MLEITSWYSGYLDDTVKRNFYEGLGVPEYWRFDPTGEYNQALLAGDRLVDGKYQPIPVHRLGDETWQGYSAVLSLNGRWERGELRWMDPATMRHIMNYADMRERADAAEARVLELEEEIRRLPHR